MASALAQLVVLEVARDGHVDVEVAQEAPRPPRVLAGDEVDLLEDAERAQGQILEVPDRRRDHVERARRHRRFFPGFGGVGAGAALASRSGSLGTVRANSSTRSATSFKRS